MGYYLGRVSLAQTCDLAPGDVRHALRAVIAIAGAERDFLRQAQSALCGTAGLRTVCPVLSDIRHLASCFAAGFQSRDRCVAQDLSATLLVPLRFSHQVPSAAIDHHRQ